MNRMERKIFAGDAVDLSNAKRDGQYYVVSNFDPDMDYAVRADDAWIWSIGKRLSDGVTLASKSSDLYQNPAFDCLWLR